MSAKPATLFDHLSHITDKKTPWDKLSEMDQKSFTPYLINRWLSMNPDYIELVDMLQQYTIGGLDRKHVYQLYLDLLPKRKVYTKYIKGKDSDKYNKELIEFIALHYQVSERESYEYVAMLMDFDKEFLIDILAKYGKTEKEIKKLLK